MLKILHVASISPLVVTGPRNSVTILSKAINEHTSCTSTIMSNVAKEKFDFNSVSIIPFNKEAVNDFDIVVFHGFFKLELIVHSWYCSKVGIPYIVCPRGGLVKHALTLSFLSLIKKSFYLTFFGFRFVRHARSVNFLSFEEQKNSLKLNKNHFFCSNILDDTNFEIDVNNKSKIIGFYGRYDIKTKGLDLLFSSLVIIKSKLRDLGWRVVLHGSNSKNTITDVLYLARKKGISDFVEIYGPLDAIEKYKFLNKVSIFIHTSRTEGQPQSVMEAMLGGCAIVITENTNMGQTIKNAECGASTAFNSHFFSEALIDMVESDNLTRKMLNARNYAKNAFSSESIARDYVEKLRLACKL